jgi:acid phosphatase type 7
MLVDNLLRIWLLMVASCFHEGPDPVGHWELSRSNLLGHVVRARIGPDAVCQSTPRIVADGMGEALEFDGKFSELVVGRSAAQAARVLPTRTMTVAAWVVIDRGTAWGNIVGCIQDDGPSEKGWSLGYNQSTFQLALATQGSDDGDGRLTYVKGTTEHQPGKLFHVVGVYDGQVAQLFVNGKLEGESTLQSGDILYSPTSPLSIGAFHDTNEFHPLEGRISEVTIYDRAAKAEWIEREFSRRLTSAQESTASTKTVGNADDSGSQAKPGFLVEPFLQFGTSTSMTVVWRSNSAAPGVLFWGEDASCVEAIAADKEQLFQSVTIDKLKPETQYFYRVEIGEKTARTQSSVSTFQTASLPGTPIAFAIVSDTQYQPAVSGKIAEMTWARRPNFVLHCGDIVDDGSKEYQWTNEFFSSMNVLLSRVPMYPVLGNHEKNAKDYYNYMALPDPEYYYTFSYGDADFFMIDSNRNLDSNSEQYQWLDQVLGKSTATWKFVCHHHPPYSSDENDYGDLWKTNKSSHGDMRTRQLVLLYEKHQVDFVWSGHIHSYERTWPIRENKAVQSGGTIYMVTGGAGGSLETPGPYRPFFQNNVRRGHHYTLVHLHENILELKAFTLDDVLFDLIRIEKPKR